ncbi:MAG: hypothetical protein R3F56_26530 [Planctomycetota bacterium]
MLASRRRAPPSFRRVGAWLGDAEHERELAVRVRATDPDVVHVLGCGGGTSSRLAWIARSLGSACTLTVEVGDLLCHRGDLVHARGGACAAPDQPPLCAVCARSYVTGRPGLSRFASACAWVARGLGDASPFPSALAFRNRRDLLASALQDADLVLARDGAARAAALGLGVGAEWVTLLPPEPDTLVGLWSNLVPRR